MENFEKILIFRKGVGVQLVFIFRKRNSLSIIFERFWENFSWLLCRSWNTWDKVFKNGLSEISGRQPLTNLK